MTLPPAVDLRFQSLPGEIGSLTFLVRAVVIDEVARYRFIEVGVAECPLDNSVAVGCRDNLARLRLVYHEAFIRLQSIIALNKLTPNLHDVRD